MRRDVADDLRCSGRGPLEICQQERHMYLMLIYKWVSQVIMETEKER
jgi:hypothetical protein